MLKRICGCLVIRDGVFTRTKNFNPDHLYSSLHLDKKYFDELAFINISPSGIDKVFLRFLEMYLKDCFLPVSIGGGLKKIEDIDYLFGMGADRVIFNEALWGNPKLVEIVTKKYGAQAIVASIDVKAVGAHYASYDWREKSLRVALIPDILRGRSGLVGEVLLQSVDRDGSVQGFDKRILREVYDQLSQSIPLNIASGFGKWEHYAEVLKLPEVDCVSVQNVHHMSADAITGLKAYCLKAEIPIRGSYSNDIL